MNVIEESLESIRQIRDIVALEADILDTTLDAVGASVDDTIYLNKLRQLAQSLSDILSKFV
jgi:hypothetical protein